MVITSDHATGQVPSIWAEDHTCRTAQNGKCKISSPKKSRSYVVRVSATDEAGNVGASNCTTIVGNQDFDGRDPLFVIAKVNTIGGVEVEDPPWECTKDDEPAPGGCFEGVNMDCCSVRCFNSGKQLCKK